MQKTKKRIREELKPRPSGDTPPEHIRADFWLFDSTLKIYDGSDSQQYDQATPSRIRGESCQVER